MAYTGLDGNGNPLDPHTIIFPILKESRPGVATLIGTGFFITVLGHFVTAKHVIFDAVDPVTLKQHHPLHALHFVQGTEVLVRDIKEISAHRTADVAVGRMDFHVLNATGKPLRNRVPIFTTTPPTVGSAVVTYAYPESDAEFSAGHPAVFRPDFYSGQYVEYSEQPRDRTLVTWPHHATSINVLGGASGGPVFDESGHVFGINCVGGIQDLSYMGRSSDLLSLNVPGFPLGASSSPTVLELARLGHILFDGTV